MVDVVNIPKKKIHIGVAFYGRGWSKGGGAALRKDGDFEDGISDYDVLMRRVREEGGKISYNKHKDQAYINFPNGDFYTFDDEVTIRVKSDFVKNYGYGGIFNWSFNCDRNFKLLD